MTAYLNCYKIETDLLVDITDQISRYASCQCISQTLSTDQLGEGASTSALQFSNNCFELLAAEFKSLNIFVIELQLKTETTLGLLFHIIRVANDEMLVRNGNIMREMMQASRIEAKISRQIAKQSQEMAVDMKKDSTSMKAIAVATMFFLPGTSFAALLSMPFFSTYPWVANVNHFWLWVAMTVPSTVFAFTLFWYYTRKSMRKIKLMGNGTSEDNGATEDIELGVIHDGLQRPRAQLGH
ncbi:hypothetical protein H072_11389 [Dactylellina haptotyla CBS 200.50]|uniref:Uncharacterized protein n=1 Tax=Dactylellina haptotyla (strain CBS 200.50) TaxID=1284197 RepID=S8BIJ9_DACHA|nr:hypothetical protein H072_11389 [Dactylellina haptotyla CBS 200.50]